MREQDIPPSSRDDPERATSLEAFSTTLHDGGSYEACHTTPPKREPYIMKRPQPKPKTPCLHHGAGIKQLLEGMHYAVDNIRWALILRDKEHCIRNLYDALMMLRDLGSSHNCRWAEDPYAEQYKGI